jgi:hypothetical protein
VAKRPPRSPQPRKDHNRGAAFGPVDSPITQMEANASGHSIPAATPSSVTPRRATGWVEGDHFLAKQTGNPLYIWRAILNCLRSDLPLPDWCLDHIMMIAINMHDLMHGVGLTTVPVRADGESDSDFAQPSLNRYNNPEFDLKDAVKFLPQALMLTRQGWSAFADFAKDEKISKEAGQYFVVADRMPARAEAALEDIRNRNNLEHARSARRRIRQGNSLLGLNDRTNPKG